MGLRKDGALMAAAEAEGRSETRQTFIDAYACFVVGMRNRERLFEKRIHITGETIQIELWTEEHGRHWLLVGDLDDGGKFEVYKSACDSEELCQVMRHPNDTNKVATRVSQAFQ